MDHKNIYEVDLLDNSRVSKKVPLVDLDVLRVIDDTPNASQGEPTCVLEFTFIDEVVLTI